MKNDLVNALACLASLPYQERYVVNGTVEAYVLPQELLDDVDGLVRRARRAENAAQFTQAQLAALFLLANLIQASPDEALAFSREDAFHMIVNGSTWCELRQAASAALAAFGHDIGAISLEAVEDGRIAGTSPTGC